jgi:CheY-like chemotaxis protein
MHKKTELPVILVADDDRDDQEMIIECMEKVKGPCQVEMVNNGLAVIERLRDTARPEPCLVVLDINMPMMNGIETLQRIRKEHANRHMPVVIFTTDAGDESRRRALSLGANDYFIKPTDFNVWLSYAGDMVKYCT